MNLKKLVNLKHLDLYGSSWANDNFCTALVGLKKLCFLSLGNTTVSTHATPSLKLLKNLQALNIGFSRINAQQV